MSSIQIEKCPFCRTRLPQQGEACPTCKRPWEDIEAAWKKDHKPR